MYIISRHIIMFDKVRIKYLVYFIFPFSFQCSSIDNNDKREQKRRKKINGIRMKYFLLLTRSKKKKNKGEILYYDRNISTKYIL